MGANHEVRVLGLGVIHVGSRGTVEHYHQP